MTPEEAMHRINTTLAHAWMVRNFLKHAEEVQDDEPMLDLAEALGKLLAHVLDVAWVAIRAFIVASASLNDS